MNNVQWIFDGIGTAIVSAIMGLLVGGFTGYKFGVKKTKIAQKQKAGDNANQIQIGINNGTK